MDLDPVSNQCFYFKIMVSGSQLIRYRDICLDDTRVKRHAISLLYT